MDPSEHIFDIFAWFSAIVLVLGVLLNGLMCLTFLRYRALLNDENILMLSIAFSDLLCCAVAIPTSMISNFNMKWIFEESGCKGHAFVVTWCGLASITHLAVLAYSSYETMALRQDKLINGKRVLHLVVALWTYSFIFAIAPVAGWSRYTIEGIGTSCSVDWQASDTIAMTYTASIFLGCFATPVGVIMFSYYKVYREVKNMSKKANKTWGKMSHLAKKTTKSQRKMAVLLFAMIVAFLLAWTPYAVVSLIPAFGRPHRIGPLTASVPAYLAKSSNLYNPLLYFMMYKRFRTKVFEFLRIRCCTPKSKQGHDLRLIYIPDKKNESIIRIENTEQKVPFENTKSNDVSESKTPSSY